MSLKVDNELRKELYEYPPREEFIALPEDNVYNKFSFMRSNRDISKSNVEKIKKSFIEHGWFGGPIIVDPNFRIIEGQHRYTAAKQLRIPIRYMIFNNPYTIKAIQDSSNTQSKWKATDNLKSLADSGNLNFKRLYELWYTFCNERGILPTNSLIAVVTGEYEAGSLKKVVDNCDFELTAKHVEIYNHKLLDLEDCVRAIKDNKLKIGRFDYVCKAAFFLLQNGAEKERLKTKIENNINKVKACSSVEEAVEMLEKIYNMRIEGEQRVHFMSRYKRYLENRY